MDVRCYNVCMCADVNVFVIQIPQHVVSPAKKNRAVRWQLRVLFPVESAHHLFMS